MLAKTGHKSMIYKVNAVDHSPAPEAGALPGCATLRTLELQAFCGVSGRRSSQKQERTGTNNQPFEHKSPEWLRNNSGRRVAALFVESGGCYFDLPGVEPWDETRDARTYAGPFPVVAHPPCQRWGRYWGGAPCKPNQYRLGDDGGCFASALASVRRWGGVLEHPEGSHAWRHFDLKSPPRSGGWVSADFEGGWTCYVEQGHYGHFSRKPTWLYAAGLVPPSLRWGAGEQRIHPVALAKHGYEKARRIGMMAMVGGKDKTRIRNATPVEFRDLLISIARTAHKAQEKAA